MERGGGTAPPGHGTGAGGAPGMWCARGAPCSPLRARCWGSGGNLRPRWEERPQPSHKQAHTRVQPLPFAAGRDEPCAINTAPGPKEIPRQHRRGVWAAAEPSREAVEAAEGPCIKNSAGTASSSSRQAVGEGSPGLGSAGNVPLLAQPHLAHPTGLFFPKATPCRGKEEAREPDPCWKNTSGPGPVPSSAGGAAGLGWGRRWARPRCRSPGEELPKGRGELLQSPGRALQQERGA